eukprot:CFRG6628T1
MHNSNPVQWPYPLLNYFHCPFVLYLKFLYKVIDTAECSTMTTKFSVKDVVLCQHQGQLYEAKVTEIRNDVTGTPEYFVHYAGWNKCWDEWVSDDRMVPPTPENMAIQKALKDEARAKLKALREEKDKKAHGKRDGRASSRLSHKAASPPVQDKAGKRSIGITNAPNKKMKSTGKEPTVIPLSDILIQQLVYDREFINDTMKLVRLPRKPSLLEVLIGFEKWMSHKVGFDDDELASLQMGLIAYFDMALGTYLLYSYERCQYRSILEDNTWTSLSSIYGAEHLLRLLALLPELIDEKDLDPVAVKPLVDYCCNLAEYLSDNIDTLFLKEYDNVQLEYVRMANIS